MIIAAQYYRPPFPKSRYWREDMKKMKESGLNAVQFWVVWAWVEAEPGIFDFSDYDELFDEAEKNGLKVILSTIAEIHPYWIHDVVPGSKMIDHMGNKVISSHRLEVNHGLTPGGCTDHPGVRERMELFLKETAAHYANRSSLIGWDCWNELRWNVNSDNLVCFCEHTIKEFRQWLKEKYKNLDGLNQAWERKYISWDHVEPGKLPNRTYSEMMEFELFLQYRAAQHAKFRYEAIKKADPFHLVSGHASKPCLQFAGDATNHAMNRGNDWDLADFLEGYGCSHFPFKYGMNDADFGIRVEATKSAAGDKVFWVSELQGGSARNGFEATPSVRAKPQQRWIWNAYSRGAKAVIIWCWRDEVFGQESSGYGLSGYDGYADERLEAMRKTGSIINKYGKLLDEYKPDRAKVGVFFSPHTCNLDWAENGTAELSQDSLNGYLKALEMCKIPYEVVESSRLAPLEHLELLIIPFPLVIPEEARAKIIKFVENGGTLFVEGEADSFTPTGFYMYPGPDRILAETLGITDLGRRVPEDHIQLDLGDKSFILNTELFVTPYKQTNSLKAIACDKQGNSLAVINKVKNGQVIALGSFAGGKYYREPYPDFENFVSELVTLSEIQNEFQIETEGNIQWRTGMSGETRLLFILNIGKHTEVNITVPKSWSGGGETVIDICSGTLHSVINEKDVKKLTFSIKDGDYAVLVF